MSHKAKPSAHAAYDLLRQQAAAERLRERELQAQRDAAKLKVEAPPPRSPTPTRPTTTGWQLSSASSSSYLGLCPLDAQCCRVEAVLEVEQLGLG
jgi:hypothetical protein